MLCQVCHQNPATIHLQMNFNGQRMQIDLCQNCYQNIHQVHLCLLPKHAAGTNEPDEWG